MKKQTSRRKDRAQRGVTLIEVLVTLVVASFGLLGLAGMVTRGAQINLEAAQRARAVVLLLDMSDRIAQNRSAAANYASTDTLGVASTTCSATATRQAQDLCEWNNALVGTNEALSSGAEQALSLRGCIRQPNAGEALYTITVAWGSQLAGIAPADDCGEDQFGADANRRVVRTQVRIANLAG